jgi:hypothetical protein
MQYNNQKNMEEYINKTIRKAVSAAIKDVREEEGVSYYKGYDVINFTRLYKAQVTRKARNTMERRLKTLEADTYTTIKNEIKKNIN